MFVILLLSLWWFLSCLDLRKHCFSSEKWQSDCDRWNLTLLLKNRNEDVQSHSFLLSECRFPKRRLQQHMAMLHSHFSFTYLDFQPLSPHQSFPIHCLPSSLPISSVCAGNDLCCCKKNIYLISIFMIKFRFTKLVWQKRITATIWTLSPVHMGNGWLS